MAPDNPDSSSDRPEDQHRGLLEQIRAIIETLAEIEEEEGGDRRASGHIDQGATRIDYDYEVSIGLGANDRTAPPREQSDSDLFRAKETIPEQGDREESIHIERRKDTDDELVVIADLPGVSDEELDVTLDADGPALELTADEEIIDRLALDDSNMIITDVRLNNQILEIRLARSSASNRGESK